MLKELITGFGLVGWFLASFIANSPVFIPFEPLLFIVESIVAWPVWILLIVASAGAVVGESISYWLGSHGPKAVKLFYGTYDKLRKIIGLKKSTRLKVKKVVNSKTGKKIKEWMKEWAFGVVIIGAYSPLPMILVSLVSGYFGYNYKKFVFACFLGKLARYTVIYYGGTAVLTLFTLGI